MPDRWRAIEAALEAALQARPEERPALLERLCAVDPELRHEVESLLAAHAEAEGFLATSAESFASPIMAAAAAREPTDRPGQIVGRYRLLEGIGRGGMGTVWLAERADGQFEQKVALKLIKRGMDSDEILARFLRERQILARLEHPNIARLLDGGVSDDGRPYFVMELVVGRAITDSCTERGLSLEERLRLFVVVARAVAHAHRNLVVHRDIKPSNVLVDEHGEIKLLDFGIAKLLSDEGDGMTGVTGRLMTPEYASPEQTAGEQVTTASDVYQLGALLYELLTDRRPYGDASKASEPLRRPSSAVRRAATGPVAERLQRRLKGDLDSIALRALRDEPESRYPSAEDLAEDVERHLAHRPIRFGGDRFFYRAAKFVRRHRLGVTGIAALILLTIGFVGFDAARVRRERDRARHEADKATEIAQLMSRFLQGWSPDASDRGEVSAKTLLGDAALRADRELRDRPEMLAATLSLLGDFHTTLGEWRAADTLLARALAIQERLHARPSADLAATLARRGRLYRNTGPHAEAVATLEKALALHRELYGPRHPETLRVQRELAIEFRGWKKPKESERLLRPILDALGPSSRDSSPFALETASELGYSLYAQAKYDEAIAILRPTLEHQRAIFGNLHASTLATIRSLGSALRDQGELEEAEVLYREALRIARILYGAEHAETEGAVFVLALVLARKGELAEAESLAREALAFTLRLHGSEHYFVWYGYGFLGAIRLDRGDAVEAEHLLRQALLKSRQASPEGDPDQGDVLNRLAYLLVGRGAADADAVYREAVAFDAARPAEQPDFVTDGIHFLAAAEHRKGDFRAAEEDYRRALRVYERQLPASHPYRIAASTGLEAVLRELGPP
ncbi:MAG TPA: serine/threonine-protein kinase [Gemmatimonadales bacterium]|jgi:serine/threonine-protein kinase|nr:serine/threonine-protein kinase [Gemmatimonadales bacterium]